MIRGRVSADRSLLVPITIVGKRRVTVRALVDTGFSGWLCLSTRFRRHVRARQAGFEQHELADGRAVWVSTYTARFIFDGMEMELPFSFTRSPESLVGTELLAKKALKIWFRKRRFVISDD